MKEEIEDYEVRKAKIMDLVKNEIFKQGYEVDLKEIFKIKDGGKILEEVENFFSEKRNNLINLYGLDNVIEYISYKGDSKNNLEMKGYWKFKRIPYIPEIINEFKKNNNNNMLKGNNLNKYLIFAIILQFELSYEGCYLDNKEIGEIIGLKNEKSIENYIQELTNDGYIRHDIRGGYDEKKIIKKAIDDIKNIFKTTSEKEELEILTNIIKVIDNFKFYIDDISEVNLKYSRQLECNINRISDKKIIHFPYNKSMINQFGIYSFFLLGLIFFKTFQDKEVQLKYSNQYYANALGCSVRMIEDSIRYLKAQKRIDVIYKDKSNKRRDYIIYIKKK